MKILFDHQAFLLQQAGGISRYFSELVSGLSANRTVDPVLSVHDSVNLNYQRIIRKNGRYTLPGTPQLWLKRLSGKIFPASKESIRNRNLSVDRLQEGKFDLFHPTYYDPYFLNHLQGKPFVITVFDMIHEQFPEYFSADRRNEMIDHKRSVIRQAGHIIAISEQTKKDVVSYYGIPNEKITTIYLASSFRPSEPSGIRQRTDNSRYLLFVGTREIYKNFDVFIGSMQGILSKDRTLQIWCAGPPFSTAELAQFKKRGIRDQLFQTVPDDEQLRELYSHALCLVYPSKYEGFGLPILEAFSCGCPVVASNTSSLPEVGGDAVLYCSPDKKDSIRDAVQRLIDSEQERQSLINRGYERLKLFSWQKTVVQTENVYTELLKKGAYS